MGVTERILEAIERLDKRLNELEKPKQRVSLDGMYLEQPGMMSKWQTMPLPITDSASRGPRCCKICNMPQYALLNYCEACTQLRGRFIGQEKGFHGTNADHDKIDRMCRDYMFDSKFTLHIRCNDHREHERTENNVAVYYGNTITECMNKARKAGWSLGENNWCPEHRGIPRQRFKNKNAVGRGSR